jgi:hypothetical protein
VATRCAESVILDERIESPVCGAPIVQIRSIEVTDEALVREFGTVAVVRDKVSALHVCGEGTQPERCRSPDASRSAARRCPLRGIQKTCAGDHNPLTYLQELQHEQDSSRLHGASPAQHKFGMFMLKAVFDRRGGELIDLAKVNLTL